jgi:hypothetical protein
VVPGSAVLDKAGGQFFLLFRFSGPEKAVADKAWQLPDIEKTS